MVADKIDNLRLYEKLSPLFAKAFDYLEKTDFEVLAPGQYPIDGENIFALCMEYETKDVAECLLEGHHTYIDIQYMIAGKEFIGFTPLADQIPYIPYDASKDIAFYKGDFSSLNLESGTFTILFPGDLHMPCVKVDKVLMVKKLVLKVKA